MTSATGFSPLFSSGGVGFTNGINSNTTSCVDATVPFGNTVLDLGVKGSAVVDRPNRFQLRRSFDAGKREGGYVQQGNTSMGRKLLLAAMIVVAAPPSCMLLSDRYILPASSEVVIADSREGFRTWYRVPFGGDSERFSRNCTLSPPSPSLTSPRKRRDSRRGLELHRARFLRTCRIETLEPRQLLSGEPSGIAISGGTEAKLFDAYVVTLDSGDVALNTWTIDWGDGAVSSRPGDAKYALHRYMNRGPFEVNASATGGGEHFAAAPLAVETTVDNLVCNGSFETPLVTHPAGWDIYDSIPCWTLVSGPNFELQRELLGGPAEGSQHLELDADEDGPDGTHWPEEKGSGAVAQTVQTKPGTEYMFSFAFSPRPDSTPEDNKLGFRVSDVESGTELLSGSLTGTEAAWGNGVYSFVARSSQTALYFEDQGTDNTLGTLLDDVIVAEVRRPAVMIATEDRYAFERYEAHGDDVNTGSFAVSLDAPTWYDVSVQFGVSGTATAGSDYHALGGQVTIPAGETSAAITVLPIDDSVQEEQFETVVVTVQTGGPYRIGYPASAELRLEDNERPSQDDKQTPGACGCSSCAPLFDIVESSGSLVVNWNCLSYQSAPDPLITAGTILPDDTDAPQTATALASIHAADGTLLGVGATVFYENLDNVSAGASVVFIAPGPVSGLATGRYEWRLKVVDSESGQRTLTGPFDFVSRDDSAIGGGWSISGADFLATQEGGRNLITGTGATTWFADADGGAPSEQGDLSFPTLNDHGDGSFDIVKKDGSRSEFDSAGRIVRQKDADGNVIAYAYVDANGDGVANEVGGIAHPDGSTVGYNYADGRLESVQKQFEPGGPVSTVATFAHDTTGRLTSITEADPDGDGPLSASILAFAYDGVSSRITSITEPGGETTSFQYDITGRVRRITYPDGTTRDIEPTDGDIGIDLGAAGYDAAHPLPFLTSLEPRVRSKDELGREQESTTDRFGNTTWEKDASGNETTYERDADGLLTRLVEPDPDGDGPLEKPVTTYTYDAKGNRIGASYPDGSTASWTYDPVFSRVTQHVGRMGEVTWYGIDSGTGRVLSTTRVVGADDRTSSETDDVTTRYTYTAGVDDPGTPADESLWPRGRLLTETDPLGGITRYEYDRAGRVTCTTDAVGTDVEASVRYEYDAKGNQTAQIDELGRRTAWEYDALNRQVKTILPDPDGDGPLAAPFTQTVYNAAGQVWKAIDVDGNVTEYEYDARGRVVRTIAPDPDGAGPLPSPVTVSVYDAAGQLFQSIDAAGSVTTFVYDAGGRQTHTVDALGNVTENRYDAQTRVTETIVPAPTLTDGLQGFWSFVAGGHRTPAAPLEDPDLSGHAHTATLSGEPTFVPGRMGEALRFDGIDDYASLGNPRELDFAGVITLSAWIVPEATNGIRNIIAHGYSFAPNGEVFLRINNGQYQVGSWDGADHLASATIPSEDLGAWVHLAGVYDSAAGQWRLYRNGQLIAATADAIGAVWVNGDWAVGARGTGTERFFSGTIDEVRIYGRAVTLDEIGILAETAAGPITHYTYDILGRQTQVTLPDPDGAGPLPAPVSQSVYDFSGKVVRTIDAAGRTTRLLYDGLGRQMYTIDALGNISETRYDAASRVTEQIAPAPTLTLGLQGFWSFVDDRPSGNVEAPDLSGNGHTATFNGDPLFVDGRLGEALRFDGVDDAIALGNPSGLDITGAITLSAWVVAEATDGFRNIVAHGHSLAPNGEVFLRINNGQYQIGSWDGANHLASASIPAGDVGQWVHLAGVYDPATTQWRLYRNGQLVAATTDATGAVSVAGDWAIGARSTGTERFFQGTIDEVRLYDRAVTPDEIAVLAETATGPVTAYVYDDRDRQVAVIQPDPDGAGPQTAPQTTSVYDAASQLTAVTDALGRTTTYVYDHAGRQTHTIDALGNSSETRYDAASRVTAQIAPAATLTASLQGFWSFVAGGRRTPAGTVLDADLSGNSHTATIIGAPTIADGRLGKALNFDGVDDYASLGNPADLNVTGAITISAWVIPEATDGLRNIIAHGYAFAPNGEVFLRINNGQYQIGSWDGANHVATAAIPSGDVGAWVHLAGVYDPVAGQWRLYRNGQLAAAATDATGAVSVAGNWAIGARGTGTERFFDGTIDEIRVYDRAVTPDEIAVLAETATGPVTQFLYDHLGRQTKIVQPDPDRAGPLTSPETQYVYNASGQLAAVVDPLGRTTFFVYDALGRQTHLIDAAGNIAETRYDGQSRVTEQIAPAPTLTDGLQGFWSLVAGGRRTPAAQEAPDLSGNGHPATLVGVPTVTDGRLGEALNFDGVNDYASLGNPPDLNITGALTLSAWIVPEATDGLRNIVAHGYATAPDGEVFLRINNGQYQIGSWNGANHFASSAIPAEDLGAWVHLAGVYDAAAGEWRLYRNGQLLAATADATGAVSVAGDWAIGARATGTERFFDGTIDEVRLYNRALTADEIGVLAETATGPAMQYIYDQLGRQTAVVQPDPDSGGPQAASETSFVYNAAGQLAATVDPLGRATAYEYDGLGRQIKITQPDPDGAGPDLAPWTVLTYDSLGNVLSKTDRLSHATVYEYDQLNRLVRESDASGGTTLYAYDAVGNRTALTDPVCNTTTWVYDALNRPVVETNALALSRTFAYDATGHIVSKTDRNGRVTEYDYDRLGRLTAERWQDGGATIRTFSFTFDAAGQMLSAADPDASYAYTYDRLGRMTTVTSTITGLTPTVTLSSRYDALGRRTQLAADIGGTPDFVTDYFYDQIGRTTSIQQHASPVGTGILPVQEKRIDFTYDLASQPATLTRYANLAGDQLVAATDYVFDQAGRLTGMTHAKGAAVFADYDWAFDAANNMTRFESLVDGVVDYTNDATGQLTGANYDYQEDESYTYDANGNRINNGYTVGPNNQLLSDGTYRYQYDAEGNRTAKFIDNDLDGHLSPGDIDVTEYTWDHRNRLTSVTHRSEHTAAPDKIVEYAYDFGNQWLRKTVATDANETVHESRLFVYDRGQIVLDFQDEGSSDLTNADLTTRSLWALAVDQILAEETAAEGSDEDVLWTLTDHQNTVRDVVCYVPQTGTTSVANHLTYDAYGNVTDEAVPTVVSLFRYTARPLDPDSGLQNNLHRWYDPTVGRWLAQDPMGLAAADTNLYRYVSNRANTSLDPLGLEEVTAKVTDGTVVLSSTPFVDLVFQAVVDKKPIWSRFNGDKTRGFLPGVWDKIKATGKLTYAAGTQMTATFTATDNEMARCYYWAQEVVTGRFEIRDPKGAMIWDKEVEPRHWDGVDPDAPFPKFYTTQSVVGKERVMSDVPYFGFGLKYNVTEKTLGAKSAFIVSPAEDPAESETAKDIGTRLDLVAKTYSKGHTYQYASHFRTYLVDSRTHKEVGHFTWAYAARFIRTEEGGTGMAAITGDKFGSAAKWNPASEK